MDIESLLNPTYESHILMGTSNAEIYQAVINVVNAHENMEVNGSDDVDDDTPHEASPNHQDVHKAVSIINRYIDELNDPIVCKLETHLVSFNWQLCLDEAKSLTNSVLTDFFQRQ